MLSLFPSFFDYSAIVVTVLRIVAAIIFITEGYKMLPKKSAVPFPKKFLSIVEFVGGVLLFVGLFTQAAAIALGAVAIKKTYFEYKKEPDEERHMSFYFLLFVVSLSFLFFGPGLWSIDYPL